MEAMTETTIGMIEITIMTIDNKDNPITGMMIGSYLLLLRETTIAIKDHLVK